MFWNRRVDGSGYTRGGLDVESAINLFFKGVLLFPIFLFAGYVGLAMMKHMIFHGIPVMNTVSEEQREVLREKDAQIGLSNTEEESVMINELERNLSPAEDPEWVRANNAYRRDMQKWRKERAELSERCRGHYKTPHYCYEYIPQPVFSDYVKVNK